MKNRIAQGAFYFACLLIAIFPLLGLLAFYAGMNRWFG